MGFCSIWLSFSFITFISRYWIDIVPFSLRIFRFKTGANITSGHMLLHILSGFTYQIMKSGIILFFVGFITISFYYCIFGSGDSYEYNSSSGFYNFNLFLHKRWPWFTLNYINKFNVLMVSSNYKCFHSKKKILTNELCSLYTQRKYS